MELKSKELFLSTLDGVMSVRHDCGLEQNKTEMLKDAVQNMPLLVPVVGEFSAGKSSLLNALMGKDVLAVAIEPETAIPAELYYSETEYDEGVRAEQSRAEQSTDRLTNLSDAAGKYVCVKRHINSPFLRDIEPVVLVDMPGFDSPLDAHNKAIFNYLDRGIHYAVLIAADAGTISRSMQRQIQNILSFKKTCTFFLSRTDLRSPEEIEQVKNELESQLSVITGEAVSIDCIRRDDVSLFSSFVHSLNVDGLFSTQFKDSVLNECYDTKNSLNTSIAALRSNAEKNSKAISELENALKKLEEKQQTLIEQSRTDNFSSEADTVTVAVGSAINADLETLVSIAKSGGSDALQEEINGVIQDAVLSKIPAVMKKISVRVSRDLTGEIEGLDKILSEYVAGGLTGRLQKNAVTMFDTAKNTIDSYLRSQTNKKDVVNACKAITDVLADFAVAAGGEWIPVIEAVKVIIPAIIDMLMENWQEGRIRECIAAQIPHIKRQIRKTVVGSLQENSGKIISAICAKLSEELQQKKDEIEKAQKAGAADPAAISARIDQYSNSVERIDDLIAKVLE